MELQLKIIGVLLIVLAFIHLIFPRYFNWRKELEPLSLVNRQMVYVHTLFIGITLLLMGAICVTSATELITTSLGHKVSLGFGAFWLARLIIQFFGYSRQLWHGKLFETIVHLVFSCLWTWLAATFFYVFWMHC